MSTTATPQSSPYAPPAHVALSRALETIPLGEAEAIQTITQVCLDLLDTASKPVLRQQHPYQHACVRATFEVLANIPDEMRVGVFAQPDTFDAIVRFSTASRRDQRVNDSHGFAIKLFGVEGERFASDDAGNTTQDFILLDSPQFFIRNAIDYAAFAAVLRSAVLKTKRGALKALPENARNLYIVAALFRRHFRHFPHEWSVLKGMRKPALHPFRKGYWSSTPYRLGDGAAKYEVYPSTSHPWFGRLEGPLPKQTDPDWLNEIMRQWLDRGPARFDFFVQRQVSATEMPIEDPTVRWSRLVSPPVRVARVHIERQEFDTPAKLTAVESLSFSPGHSLAVHGPLGGINRTRLAVYRALADRRRELNGISSREPDADWIDRVWEARAASD